jgi:hypothetical protein
MLSPLQRRVLETVRDLPQAKGFALAGGGALILAGAVARATDDLDFFAQTPSEVAGLVPALEAALERAGFSVERVHHATGFVRLQVSGDGDITLVDLSYDARIHPVVEGPNGTVLSLDELAADKTLAVFGRAEARDFIDLRALTAYYTLGELMRLASTKDPGFELATFYEALGSFGRHPRETFGLGEQDYEDLRSAVDRWRVEVRQDLERGTPGHSLEL